MPTLDGICTIGILVFDDVEVLDFSGPFEVFSVAGRLAVTGKNRGGPETATNVYLLAQNEQPVKAQGGFTVQPHYSIENHPELDLVVIPGGWGVWAARQQKQIIAWVKQIAQRVSITSSVCTGAFLLGEANLLEQRQATTHWASLDRLSREFPTTEVHREVRWVDNGTLVTSAGIEAGIDMSLHLVERLLGREVAEKTAIEMEYSWRENHR